nr:SMI1/KNR4 family protein [Micromonospora sp. DSM 115978]
MTVEQVEQSWSRIANWLRKHTPATYESLNPPASRTDIEAAEHEIGTSLPADLVALLLIHNGSDRNENPTYSRFLFPGRYGLMSLDRIVSSWRTTTSILDQQDECMVGYWWHPLWIPFGETATPDCLIIDQRPGDTCGQLGEFHSHDSTKIGSWPSLGS